MHAQLDRRRCFDAAALCGALCGCADLLFLDCEMQNGSSQAHNCYRNRSREKRSNRTFYLPPCGRVYIDVSPSSNNKHRLVVVSSDTTTSTGCLLYDSKSFRQRQQTPQVICLPSLTDGHFNMMRRFPLSQTSRQDCRDATRATHSKTRSANCICRPDSLVLGFLFCLLD